MEGSARTLAFKLRSTDKAEKLGSTGYGPSSTCSLRFIDANTPSVTTLSTFSRIILQEGSRRSTIPASVGSNGLLNGRRAEGGGAGLNTTASGQSFLAFLGFETKIYRDLVFLFGQFPAPRLRRNHPRRLAWLPPVARQMLRPLRSAARDAYHGTTGLRTQSRNLSRLLLLSRLPRRFPRRLSRLRAPRRP